MRKLQPNDAPELARLIHTIWPDDNPDPARIARVSLDSSRLTLLQTTAADQITGFVACFPTTAADRTLRWEVDLLGVHPDYRQQRIAQRLVQAAVEEGKSRRAKLARALIRIGNTASMNTFLRCGFSLDPAILDLYVADGKARDLPNMPRGLHLIPVDTLTYSGTWIEGNLSHYALRYAQITSSGVVGALIPAGMLDAAQVGFDHINQFRWVTRTL